MAAFLSVVLPAFSSLSQIVESKRPTFSPSSRRSIRSTCFTSIEPYKHRASSQNSLAQHSNSASDPPQSFPDKRPEDPPDYSRAMAVEASGNTSLAISLYQRFLERHPEYGKAWVRLSSLFAKLGQADEARQVLRDALIHLPQNAIIWQRWADLEKSLGNNLEARRLFRRALQVDKTLVSVYSSWGKMEFGLGDVASARKLLSTGAQYRSASSARLFYTWGIIEDSVGRAESARVIFSKGIGVEPTNPFLHQALGVLEFKEGNISSARESFRKATTLKPTHTISWLSWGQLEELQGNPSNARNIYKQGIEVRDGQGAVQLWQAWARLEEKQDNWKDALDVYDDATKQWPRDPVLYTNWGKLLLEQKEIVKARMVYRRGMALDTFCAYLWQSAAILEQEQLAYEDARRLFAEGAKRAAGARAPSRFSNASAFAALLYAWASMEWKLKDEEKARGLFTYALDVVKGRSGWLLRKYGKFEMETGNYDLARYYLCQSINLDPKCAFGWRDWGELEMEFGNKKRAEKCFRHAVKLESKRNVFEKNLERPLARPWQN
mmetsp:Transcript_19445/g.51709  ORF Transcript_19445/g.51709 Transcript_19445/m.51709 type:complete len:551 (-) Transcript_19445:477-2129(-)